MDQFRVDAVTRFLSGVPSRRHLLRGLAGAGLGLGVARAPDSAAAKKKRHKKRRRKNQDDGPLCARNGGRCDRQGGNCQARYCLKAPFTAEAIWENASTHFAYLYVPPGGGAADSYPFIYYDCTAADSACAEKYPFACGDPDLQAPGSHVFTIYDLLPGIYEYWTALAAGSAAGELVIVLRDAGGRVVRQWTNPANTTSVSLAWRVFACDGEGHVTSLDTLLGGYFEPSVDVCPYMALGRQARDRTIASARRHRS